LDSLLSIIINNYNYGRFLSAAIESALAQTYSNVEVLVVDDGSVDDSRAVISRYGSRVVPVLKQNGGQASAINAGFARSRGDIIIFLDSDDVLMPGIGARVVETFAAQPDCGKVEYRMNVIDAQGRPTGGYKPAGYLRRPSGDLRSKELRSPFEVLWMSTSGNAFSRHVLGQMLPVPEDGYPVCGADWYLAHISPFFGPVVFLDDVGASYRVHDANQYTSERLDLKQIRQSVVFMRTTLGYIEQTAARTGLLRGLARPKEILSFSYIAQRMISLKLDPPQHPIQDEQKWSLLALGLAALRRRCDISVGLKLAMFAWLVSVAAAPRGLAWYLAEQFMVPESRPPWVMWAINAAHRRHAGRMSRTEAEPFPLAVG
jgi:hypothetical protein